MKYSDKETFIDADDALDAQQSTAVYEARLQALQEKLADLGPGAASEETAAIRLAMAAILIELERGRDAFAEAYKAFQVYSESEIWEDAVRACELMYQAEQPDSLAALGQGIWLAVTFPGVDPELTVTMLGHVVEDTPDDSDGAALAAAVAKYVVDLRCEGKKHENLAFFVGQMLGDVARRHSQVENQGQFDFWVERLELDKPDSFIPRMSEVIDVLVDDNWWFDRDALRARLPVN